MMADADAFAPPYFGSDLQNFWAGGCAAAVAVYQTATTLRDDRLKQRWEKAMQTWAVIVVTCAYIAVLFAIAGWGDRKSAAGVILPARPRRAALVYALTLAVYNTSWSFYGSVGRAATSGWDFLPIYIGPALVLLGAQPILAKVIALTKAHNVTSIADFIAARYGKSRAIAASVTLTALVGVLPYIALQLKAVGTSFDVLTAATRSPSSGLAAWNDTPLATAVAMAVFAILFGVRHIHTSDHHRGLMLAIAFESLIKLACFVAVAIFIVFGVFDGPGDLFGRAANTETLARLPILDLSNPSWVSNTLISAIAFLCLPHAFHVAAVENEDPSHIKHARWLYPAYLLGISVFMVPVALAGRLTFGSDVDPDTYMISLPVHAEANAFSLIAFLGGLSAATGMVIVAAIALSTMLCNDVVLPMVLRMRAPVGAVHDLDLARTLLNVRRAGIVVTLGLAYGIERMVGQAYPLTQMGLISFVAVAQFGPAFLGGLYWRRASCAGAMAGLACGFAVWGYCLLLPAAGQLVPGISDLVALGPGGWTILRPLALFGLEGLDPISHATSWSLAANTLAYVLVSGFGNQSAIERAQASAFVDGTSHDRSALHPWQSILRLGDLRELAVRLVGTDRGEGAFDAYLVERRRDMGPRNGPSDFADRDAIRFTENLVAGAVGAPSARILMATSLGGYSLSRKAALAMLDEASEAIHFNRRLLQSTIENVSQGILVVDETLHVMVWNARLAALLDLPLELLQVGAPLTDITAFNVARGEYRDDELSTLIINRDIATQTWPYIYVRRRPTGTVLEASYNRLPEGGFVATYADITERARAAEALRDANERLEEHVRERTQALFVAKAQAEKANASKTRFLAAASHDLLQPLNAARLFAAALEEQMRDPIRSGQLARNVVTSLSSAEQLIATLLDISALDAGGVTVATQNFAVAGLLTQLEVEFRALADDKGLQFTVVNSSVMLKSDPQLLRRVLQNLLGNAIRYTSTGRVLLGCRRRGDQLIMEIWDTGPGIPSEQHGEIFEEFRRCGPDTGMEKGLGLGLAIVDRIARKLDHSVTLRSREGCGSCFALEVPRAYGSPQAEVRRPEPRVGLSLDSLVVLCIDDDDTICEATEALISSWGATCIATPRLGNALERLADRVPDLVLVDYHLRGGTNGLQTLRELRRLWDRDVAGLLITADRSEPTRCEGLAEGCEVLLKPVRPAALRRFLGHVALRRTPRPTRDEHAA